MTMINVIIIAGKGGSFKNKQISQSVNPYEDMCYRFLKFVVT